MSVYIAADKHKSTHAGRPPLSALELVDCQGSANDIGKCGGLVGFKPWLRVSDVVFGWPAAVFKLLQPTSNQLADFLEKASSLEISHSRDSRQTINSLNIIGE